MADPTSLPAGWEPFDGSAPLDTQSAPAAPSAPDNSTPSGWEPAPDNLQLDPAPKPTPDQQPIIISALRPHNAPQTQFVDPSTTVKGFSNEVSPDYHPYSTLSPADMAEYKSFFKSPKNPPSAAFLQTWYHGKTGANLGNAQAIIDAYRRNGQVNLHEHIDIPSQHQGGIGAGLNHLANGLVADYGSEAGAAMSATGNSVANAFGLGDGKDWSTSFNNEADLNHAQLGTDSVDHPVWSAAGELAGAAATIPLTDGLSQVTGLSKLGAVPSGIIRGGLEGAAFGSGNAGPGNRIQGAGGGAALGILTGGVLSGAAKQTSKAANVGATDAADRLNADLGTNIQPTLATSAEGPVTQTLRSGSNSTILGGAQIGRDARQFTQSTTEAKNAIQGKIGSTNPNLEDAVSQATDPSGSNNLTDFGGRERARIDGLYTKAENLTGNPTLQVPQTVGFLDSQIARLKAAGEDITSLKSIRDWFAKGQPLSALRDKRSLALGSSFDRANGDIVNGALKKAWGLSGEEIDNGLRSQGLNDGADALKVADKRYQGSLADRQAISSIIEGKDPDQVTQSILGMSQRNGIALQRVLNAAPNQAPDILGGIVERLGQTKANPTWSADVFAANWRSPSMPQSVKDAFGAETSRALDDLATLGSMARGARALENNSGTARAAHIIRIIEGVGDMVGLVKHPAVAAGEAVGSAVLGRVLTSRGFSRALVNIAKTGRLGPNLTRLQTLASRMSGREGGPVAQAIVDMVSGKQPLPQTPFNKPYQSPDAFSKDIKPVDYNAMMGPPEQPSAEDIAAQMADQMPDPQQQQPEEDQTSN